MSIHADATHSYYQATAIKSPSFSSLTQSQKCDVCIIGGGYTGLSTALHLAKLGYDVNLLESHTIGWGASGRNGGQVCSGFNQSQASLTAKFGFDKAMQLWQIGEKSTAIVRSLIETHHIPCDYQPGIIHAAYKASEVPELEKEVVELQQKFGYQDIEFLDKNELKSVLNSPIYHGGQYDKGSGHLHPLNFSIGLADAAKQAGASIYEQSEVVAYEENNSHSSHPISVTLKNGVTVKAKHLVLATNGYLGKLDRQRSAYIMPINNYILATEPLGEEGAKTLIANNAAVSDTKFVVNYYRLSADNRLIYGGGENYSASFPSDIKSFVRPHMLKTFPQLADTKIDYAWGGTLAITMNRLPDFGVRHSRIFHMLGYSGQGVALATLAGKLVAEKIHGKSKDDIRDFDLMTTLTNHKFPGGALFRRPGQIAGMLFYSLRDKIGI